MRTGHPKGAAFIEFADRQGLDTAITMSGKQVRGKLLSLLVETIRFGIIIKDYNCNCNGSVSDASHNNMNSNNSNNNNDFNNGDNNRTNFCKQAVVIPALQIEFFGFRFD